MRTSVIIPTYNRARMVKEAIDSVLCQTFHDFELIIVDNYSSDDTESLVSSYHEQRIRYFKNHNNGLVSINRNFGISKARGEYIAFLDDDDLWLPEKLEKQVEILDSNKELGLVYSDSYYIDDSVITKNETIFTGIKPIRGFVLAKLLQDNPIPLLTVVIRREVLDKVGVFNTAYKVAQDYDLWLRINQHYQIDFVKQPLAGYRRHSGAVSSKNFILKYKEDLQIRSNWLKKNPKLIKEIGGKCRALKYWSVFLGALGNIYRNKNLKSISDSAGLIKYMLLREYEKE